MLLKSVRSNLFYSFTHFSCILSKPNLKHNCCQNFCFFSQDSGPALSDLPPEPVEESDHPADIDNHELQEEDPPPPTPASSSTAAPASSSTAAPASHARGPATHHNVWVDVLCARCSTVSGQIKYDPSPGLRDPATWVMRVRHSDGSYPGKGPTFRRRSCTIVGESDEFAKDWVLTNKQCCSL